MEFCLHLHTLRNDQIYPTLWETRKRNTRPITLKFIDLYRLKQELRQGSAPEALNDELLERTLYGTDAMPIYSGWTWQRLTRTLEHSGYQTRPDLDNEDRWLVTVVAQPHAQWGDREYKAALLWRRKEKIWSARKALRAKFAETLQKGKNIVRYFGGQGSLLSGKELCLNLGAGAENYPGYVKVDLSGVQHIYDNIVTLSRIQNGSVSKIYCNHVLEHIPTEAIQQMLKRWKEVLAPGGHVVARTPDARQAVLSLGESWQEADEKILNKYGVPNFLEREAAREGRLDDDSGIQTIYGWSNSTPHGGDWVNQHKSLWTPALARKRFEQAGFNVEYAENLGTLNTLLVAR